MVRRTFAKTWWGRAWIDALENRARLDPNRLPRGRTYARQDRVWGMTVEPGVVTAVVQGRRRQPYRVTVRIRPLTDEEWDRVLGAVVARAAHAAALLDGEMDPGIVDDARAAGVDLFPTAGELVPRLGRSVQALCRRVLPDGGSGRRRPVRSVAAARQRA